MIIYIVLILICTIIAYLIPRIKNKKIQILMLISIIFSLSIVGGARDFSVGTDVEVYGAPWFEAACRYDDLGVFIEKMGKEDTGYVILNFIISRFTNSVNVFLFVVQLICTTFIMITLYHYKEKVPLWLSTLTYLSVYHFRSYNFIRQTLAMSIFFFALRFLEKKKPIKYIISIIIASQFHFTTIICLAFYPLRYIIDKNKKVLNFILIIGIIITFIITINIIDVLTILYDLGIINERIYSYTQKYTYGAADFNIIEIAFRLVFILMYMFRFKELNSKFRLNKFFFVCSILDIILFQLRNFIQYTDRFAFYFGYMTILMVPQLPDKLSFTYKNKVVLKSVFAVVLIVFWYYKFVVAGSCEIYPYTSSILGI